jgi:putative flippase GtrA
VIKRELVRFALVGVATVTIAYIIYRTLVFFGLDRDISNGIAYAVGVCISFFLNKSWTFSNKKRSHQVIIQFLVLHIFSLFACVFVNSIAFTELTNEPFRVEIAFIFGIATSTLLNFIGMKYFVFRKSRHIQGKT